MRVSPRRSWPCRELELGEGPEAGDDGVDLVRVERLERAVDLGRGGAHFEELVAYARETVQGCVCGPGTGPVSGAFFRRIGVDSWLKRY